MMTNHVPPTEDIHCIIRYYNRDGVQTFAEELTVKAKDVADLYRDITGRINGTYATVSSAYGSRLLFNLKPEPSRILVGGGW